MKQVKNGRLVSTDDAVATGIEGRIARMESRIAVQELLLHYARCVDVQDAQGIAAAFVEEGALCGPGMQPIRGKTHIEKLYKRLLSAMKSSLHLIGQQQVLFESDDCALSHAAFYAWDSYHDEDVPDCLSYGFYEVKALRESDGEWRIAALNIYFAGQFDVTNRPSCDARFCEQFDHPWPPVVFE